MFNFDFPYKKISVEGIATIVADSSTKFINDNKPSEGLFHWQDSATAFSVSKSDVDNCASIFLMNPNTIRKKTFKEEYDELINHCQREINWEIR